MIYSPLSSIVRSTERPLAVGAVLAADGQALVASNVNGKIGVAPSAGTTGEQFVGFVNAQTSAAPFLEQSAVKVDSGVASAGGSLALTFTPLASSLIILDAATNATVAGWTLAGSTVTGLTAGQSVKAVYTYALTVAQAVALMGNQVPSGYAGSLLGSTGVAQGGVVYTSMFDTSVNWASATGVKLAANGKVTNQAGSGSAINAVIVGTPSADFPYLGLQFTAP